MTTAPPSSDFDPWRIVQAIGALLVAAYAYIFKGMASRMDRIEEEAKQIAVRTAEATTVSTQVRDELRLLREDVHYIRNRVDSMTEPHKGVL